MSTSSNMKFRKGKLLGRGAFGSVYQAMNVMSGELLAIKQIPITDSMTGSALRGIEREIAINSSLPPHPHCVRYVGMETTSRNIYIIMEHVSGGSIQALLQSVGRFHEATMRRYSRMVLLGLQHLHNHNVVHQDIKGANVLIDERGTAKIADFGCSRDLSRTSSVGGNAGTPLWMAPEVCRGEPASKCSDIWSFGCLLLEMTSEEMVPWVFAQGTSAFAVLYAIGAACRPPQAPAHLSSTAKDFVAQCLQIDPAKRATVGDLLRHAFITAEASDGAEEWAQFEDSIEEDRDDGPVAPAADGQKSMFVLNAVDEDDDDPVVPLQQQHQQQLLSPPQAASPLSQQSLSSIWASDGPVVWQSGNSQALDNASSLYHMEEVGDRTTRNGYAETNSMASFLAKKFKCIRPS